MAVEHIPPSTYILRNAVDVSVPTGVVSWWPQTLGWKILFLLIALGLGWIAYRKVQHWWVNRYRYESLDALNTVASLPAEQQAEAVSFILKRCAIYAFGAEQVAPLHGSQWLGFLSSTCEGVSFDNDMGQRWQQAVFAAPGKTSLEPEHLSQLFDQAKKWVAEHKAGEQDG